MTRNQNKSKTSDESDGSRRRSARLADLDKEKPKETAKVAKKEVSKKIQKKKADKKSQKDRTDDNHVEQVVENKGDEEQKDEEIPNDFEVVNKEDVPAPDSEEVTEAIKAQEVHEEKHEDVPAVKDIPVTVNGNGTISNNIGEKSSKDDVKSTVEPQSQETPVEVSV